MKNILTIALLTVLALSCKTNKKQQPVSDYHTNTTSVAIHQAMTLDSVWKQAENLINQEITVKGKVTQTCKFSGKRCFVKSSISDETIRVEAKGQIGGFNRELIGSEIAIKGLLKEQRFTLEQLNKSEQDILEKKKSAKDLQSIEKELSNIKEMQQWIQTHQKEYYSVYYIDGLDYEVVE